MVLLNTCLTAEPEGQSTSTMVCPLFIAFTASGSNGILPVNGRPFSLQNSSIFSVFAGLVSCLLIQTPIFVRNVSAVFMLRSISLIPEIDGSATIKTLFTPLREAMTAQPMPGEPSMMASLVSGLATVFICFLTSVTSFPEVPLPIFRCAVEKTLLLSAYSVSSPATAGFKETASAGQTASQTPQPSQAKESTLKPFSSEIASNRQFSLHSPHSMHLSTSISAFGIPK